VTVRVLGNEGILVLLLCLLPDLDFHTTTDDTDSHGGEKVVSSVGVEVDTTVEHSGGILTDTRADHSLTTRVVVDEARARDGKIVYNASYRHQLTAVLALLDVVIPLHDGKRLKGSTPVELSTLAVNLLLELLDATLLNLVGTELLEVVGEAELLPDPDGPLGRVVLVPLDGVAVVGGELVVEVVVTLAESDDGGDDVITGRVAVVERLVTEPVGKGVDTEGSLLNEEDTEDTGVDETTEPVAPAETGDESRESETHTEDDLKVVLVLPDDDGVVVEVRDVGTANSLGVLLHEHPAEVRVEETLANGVGVFLSVGVTVVSAVVSGPPSDGAFDGTTTNGGEEDLERKSGLVRGVGPQTMVASSDTETGSEVVCNCPDGGVAVERGPPSLDQTEKGNANNEEDVEPVDMLVPVGLGHRGVGDVRPGDMLVTSQWTQTIDVKLTSWGRKTCYGWARPWKPWATSSGP
jgi:hypothetical protein